MAQEPIELFLDNKAVKTINSALKSEISVSDAIQITANKNKCFQGVKPVGMGFIVTESQVLKWAQICPRNIEVLKAFSMGKNLAANVNGEPERWIIDFTDLPIEEASNFQVPFNWVRDNVKPQRDSGRDERAKKYWWKFERTRTEMRQAVASLKYCFAVPRVSKWAVFLPFPCTWLPGDKSLVVASEDFYILGILLSDPHRTWMHAQKSTLKADIAYTHNTCFEAFPFPQTPSVKIVQQIRAKAIELHQYRSDQMQQKQWGITKLYNAYFHEPASQLYKLHKQLDALVLQAYGFDPTDDLLEKLLALNLALAAKEKRGEPVVGPWDPTQPPSEV